MTVKLEEGDLVRAIDALKSSALLIRKIILKSEDMQGEHILGWKEFWENVGRGIHTLELRNCDISERTFFNILNKCPKVKHLILEDCNALFMSGKLLDAHIKFLCDVPEALLSLRGLDLSNNRYLSDALFNRIVSFAKNLERLSLAGCQISFHNGIFKRFYPSNGSVTASESVLTFQNIVKFIEHQSSKLECLDFSSTLVDDAALEYISKIPGLELKELYLIKCSQVTKRGIEAFCSRQPHLRIINLARCIKLDSYAMSSLALYCQDMETLNLSSLPCLTDEVLSKLVPLPCIKQLDISFCEKLTSSGLSDALCSMPLRSLVSLHLSGCSLDQEALIKIVSQAVMLQHLDLDRCRLGMTNRALHAISMHLKYLRSLNIAMCCAVTDVGLTGCYYKLPVLKPKVIIPSLMQNGYKGAQKHVTLPVTIVEVKEDVVDGQAKPLNKLCRLQTLNLSGCSEITDVGLKVAVHFPELVALDLSHCQKITDSGLLAVGASNGCLESINLSYCEQLTDGGILNLAKLLPRLRRLDIQVIFTHSCRKYSTYRLKCAMFSFLITYAHDTLLEFLITLSQVIRVNQVTPRSVID